MAADKATRKAGQARADLLTPIAKSFSTDIGCEVASIGVQIHGGMGFIEETGAGQYYRDARILPIYEGTNGIQAIDLVTRKLPLGNGAVARAFIAEMKETAERAHASNNADMIAVAASLDAGLAALEHGDRLHAGESPVADPTIASPGASPYLRLFGTVAGGHFLARAALDDPAGRRSVPGRPRLARSFLCRTGAAREPRAADPRNLRRIGPLRARRAGVRFLIFPSVGLVEIDFV